MTKHIILYEHPQYGILSIECSSLLPAIGSILNLSHSLYGTQWQVRGRVDTVDPKMKIALLEDVEIAILPIDYNTCSMSISSLQE